MGLDQEQDPVQVERMATTTLLAITPTTPGALRNITSAGAEPATPTMDQTELRVQLALEQVEDLPAV